MEERKSQKGSRKVRSDCKYFGNTEQLVGEHISIRGAHREDRVAMRC